MIELDQITEDMLRMVSEFDGTFHGAYNIRKDGECAARQSTEHIKLESRVDGKGLVIQVLPGTKGEKVYIPACVTHGNVDDLVYNDFYIGEGADVEIIAGCGVHTDDHGEARHNGIHRFFLGKNARAVYREKHIGEGRGDGSKRIDPVTDITLEEGASLEMDTVQLGGVDESVRKTTAVLGPRARLVVRERIMTDYEQRATTDFDVVMEGEDSAVDLVSRSVARGHSYQEFNSQIHGNNRCTGHSECDAILVDQGRVNAAPALEAAHLDAALIHEAAIGKIAGEQILKLRTLGLTTEEAEEQIINGFLK